MKIFFTLVFTIFGLFLFNSCQEEQKASKKSDFKHNSKKVVKAPVKLPKTSLKAEKGEIICEAGCGSCVYKLPDEELPEIQCPAYVVINGKKLFLDYKPLYSDGKHDCGLCEGKEAVVVKGKIVDGVFKATSMRREEKKQ